MKLSENWTRENLAWLAGLFEGEGSINVNKKTKACRFTISITSTDLDVLNKTKRLSGIGNVNGPYKYKEGKKPYWHWIVSTRDHVIAISYAIHPFMCSRRRAKILEIISLFNSDPTRQAETARVSRLGNEHKLYYQLAKSLDCSIDEAKNFLAKRPN